MKRIFVVFNPTLGQDFFVLEVFMSKSNDNKAESEQDKQGVKQNVSADESCFKNNAQNTGTKIDAFKVKASHSLCKIAVLSAIGFILYLIRFPLPFIFPSFLDFQISDLPAILGGFSMGPIAGCVIVLIKTALKMYLQGSSFAGVGDLANFAIGCAFVVVSSLIYRAHKSKKRAVIGLVAGCFVATFVAVLMNRFVLVPLMASLPELGWDALVGVMQKFFPEISESNFYNYYIPFTTLPFNLLRCIITGVITFFIYKKLSRVLHW